MIASLSIRSFTSLITYYLKVLSFSVKGKLFLLVSETNKGQGFRRSWTELSS